MKERYENIREMNEILLKIEGILTKAEEVLDEWKAVQPDYDRLVAYYDSKQWRKDYFDSNDGKIPDEVPQWVLTQDAIFDAIGTQVSLADEFQKLVKTLKNKEWEQQILLQKINFNMLKFKYFFVFNIFFVNLPIEVSV